MRLPLAFLDFETTGMSSDRDAITDIGLLRVEPDGARSEWLQLVNPGMRIPSHITALTGISDAMVAGAPRFPEVAGELESRLGGALIVTHNATFDIGFLTAGLRRCGTEKRFPHVCSVRIARKLLPSLKSRSLDALSSHFGLRFCGMRHRAYPDAEMLCRIWFALRDAVGDEAFFKAVETMVKDLPALAPELPKPMVPVIAANSAPPEENIPAWPFSGPVVMASTRRAEEWHVFHEWRHLGTVRDEREISLILETRRGVPFVHATYRRIVTALATPGVSIRTLA